MRLQLPKTGTPLTESNAITRVWRDFLAALEQRGTRTAAAQPNSAAADLATLRADHNALLAKLRAAGLMEP